MKNIKIKEEYLPKRCEICHQTDLFDKFNNSCQRCNQLSLSSYDIEINNAQRAEIRAKDNLRRNDRFLILAGKIGFISGVLLVLIAILLNLNTAGFFSDPFALIFVSITFIALFLST